MGPPELEDLLGKLSYADIPTVGGPDDSFDFMEEFRSASPASAFHPVSLAATSRRSLAASTKLWRTRGGGRPVAGSQTKASRSPGKGPSEAREWADDKEKEASRSPTRAALPQDIANTADFLSLASLEAVETDAAESLSTETFSRSKEIDVLEGILSLAYNDPVSITRIRELPTTRKEVKEVTFRKGNLYPKVWVFKAEPKETAKELAAYHIIHNRGIPTGKPIGFTPSPEIKEYPFPSAILGGIVEHAGDPYDVLMDDLVLQPKFMQETAVIIARLIADYHCKLTQAKDEFAKYDIDLSKANPRQEIHNSFMAGLGLKEENVETLVLACESLAGKQKGSLVASHGDIHTGNIVTVKRQYATIADEFGVIDWGSLTLDNPYGDLRDYWVHHKRKAEQVCGSYDFSFADLVQAYESECRLHSGNFLSAFPDERESLIQSMLKNLKEMYDPVRKDEDDIVRKARYHYKALSSDLERLEMFGYEEARVIGSELRQLLRDKEYLRGILE